MRKVGWIVAVSKPQEVFKFVGQRGQLTLKAIAKPREKISGDQKRKVVVLCRWRAASGG